MAEVTSHYYEMNHLVSFKTHCLWNIYHFRVLPDIPEVPFDMSRVYPLKQREVYKIYKLTKDLPFIKHVWIFGSSVRMDCDIRSDTDIMIETTFDHKEFPKCLCDALTPVELACSVGCDLIRRERISERDFVKLVGYKKGVELF